MLRKRKADVIGRLETKRPKLEGKGSLDGWTSCPLCGKYSKKKYALGRGIAAHLNAIHQPWNPTKMSLKIARRKREEKQRASNAATTITETNSPSRPWTPTQDEMDEWNEKVIQIIREIEENFKGTKELTSDRIGNLSVSYRESLPVFLKAAAEGDIETLQRMVDDQINNDVQDLLDTKDKHLSTAGHWAAGGGHLECLKFLMEMRRKHCNTNHKKTKLRRRDGKTSLHYACRNGHLDCIKYLLGNSNFTVDEPSGEKTTPFHMACFGGHLNVVKYLASQGANVHAMNEWGCDASQFVGMTISKSVSDVRSLCHFLKYKLGINFARTQYQGHTILHKAAQKCNRHVIQWLADKSKEGACLTKSETDQIGEPDLGGHLPSEIWRKFGGDAEFEEWMKSLGW